MTTTNTFGIVFFLKLNRLKDKKAPLYVRVTVDGKRCDIALKTLIDPEEWNSQKGMMSGKGIIQG